MGFKERLKRLRKERKWTQEELGKKINVTKVSVSGYENGNRSPDTETLQKIADIFMVTVDYLLGRSDDPELTETEETQMESDVSKWMKAIESLPPDEANEVREMVSSYAEYLVESKKSKGKS